MAIEIKEYEGFKPEVKKPKKQTLKSVGQGEDKKTNENKK